MIQTLKDVLESPVTTGKLLWYFFLFDGTKSLLDATLGDPSRFFGN